MSPKNRRPSALGRASCLDPTRAPCSRHYFMQPQPLLGLLCAEGQDNLKGAFQEQQRLQSPTLHRQSGRPRSPPRQAPSPGSSSTFLPHARSPITFASAKHLLRSACRQRTFIVGNDPWGGISFRLGCGGGITKTWSNEALKNCFVMFPPPHPSLKEMPPQGVISYDEDGLD